MIAAGPSLEGNAHHLLTADERILKIAVDAATPFLWKRGIVPDVVVTAEEQCRAALIFQLLNGWYPSVVLCASTTTNPFCLRVLQDVGVKQIFFYHNAHPWLARDGRFRARLFDMTIPSITPSCGSITFHAVRIAEWLGIKPSNIAIVGCDMQVSAKQAETGKTHAGEYRVEGIPVEVINQSFQNHLRELEHSRLADTGIINASEAGRITFFKQSLLHDFLLSHAKTEKTEPQSVALT